MTPGPWENQGLRSGFNADSLMGGGWSSYPLQRLEVQLIALVEKFPLTIGVYHVLATEHRKQLSSYVTLLTCPGHSNLS